jgi:hypothetical protein
MPQFDVFIFFSSIFYLLIGFYSLMFYNQFIFLPKIASILKLREKLLSFSHKNEAANKVSALVKISKNLY